MNASRECFTRISRYSSRLVRKVKRSVALDELLWESYYHMSYYSLTKKRVEGILFCYHWQEFERVLGNSLFITLQKIIK